MNNKLKFILFIMGMALLGGIIGYTAAASLSDLKVPTYKFELFFEYDMIYYALALLSLLSLLVSFSSSLPAEEPSGEDDVTSMNEKILSKQLIYISYSIWLSLVWFIVSGAQLLHNQNMSHMNQLPQSVNVLVAALVLIIATVQQIRLLKQYNRVYPNRRVDLMSTNGREELFAKMDEAEKYITYKASYRAFTISNYMAMTVLIILAFGMVFGRFSPFPLLAVALIWIVPKMIYFHEVKKMQ